MNLLHRWIVSSLTLTLTLTLGACGAPPPPAAPPPHEPQSAHKMVNPLADDDEDQDGMQVEGTLGTIDQGAIEAGLSPLLPRVTACFTGRVAREPYLGGEIRLQFRVARDGALRSVAMTESSVGSWSVEQCIRKQVAQARFERPRGGEAEFSYALTFQGRVAPLVWDPGMVKDEVLKHVEDLLTVKEGSAKTTLTAPEGLVLTFYVDRRGRPVSVGMTATAPIEDAFAEALIANLKKVEFVDPQQRYAKVTYSW